MSWKSLLICLFAILWFASIFASGLLIVLLGVAVSGVVIWQFYRHKKRLADDSVRLERFISKFTKVFSVISVIFILWFFVELAAAPTETMALECLVCYGDGCSFCEEMGWIMGTHSDTNPGAFRSLFIGGCSAIIAYIAACEPTGEDSE